MIQHIVLPCCPVRTDVSLCIGCSVKSASRSKGIGTVKPSSGLASQAVNIKFPSHGSGVEVELCSQPAGEQTASGLRIQGLPLDGFF